MSHRDPDVFRSPPARLARLFELDPENVLAWQEAEMAAVLRHQLAAPIETQAVTPAPADHVPAPPRQSGTPTLAELCSLPCPPLAPLRASKDFAQAHLHHDRPDIPRAVAEVIYYLAIALARSRCGERITRLPDAEVARGIDWALTLPWLDRLTRETLAQARRCYSESA